VSVLFTEWLQCSATLVLTALLVLTRQQHMYALCVAACERPALLTAGFFACLCLLCFVLAVSQTCKYAVARDVLPDGTVIPAGSQVIYSAYAGNCMETFWGADALAFRPDRWLEMDATPTPYHYLTFNAGMDSCRPAGCLLLGACSGWQNRNWPSCLYISTQVVFREWC